MAGPLKFRKEPDTLREEEEEKAGPSKSDYPDDDDDDDEKFETSFKSAVGSDTSSLNESIDNTTVDSPSSSRRNDHLTYYIDLVKSGDKKIIDSNFGVRKRYRELYIGDAPFEFDDEFLHIKKRKYPRTRGIIELLFKHEPDMSVVNSHDLNHYGQIVGLTNAHRKSYRADGDLCNINSEKYQNIISKLALTPRTPHAGGKLPQYMIANREKLKTKGNIDYIYWDDPNELVDRLKLLLASQNAGNFSHNNEIISIIEELKEGGVIY